MFKHTNIFKWLNLTRKEKMVWLKAAISLFCISFSLKVLSFSQFQNLFRKLAGGDGENTMSPEEVQRITWAVRSAASHLPISLLCLPQALATKYLLRDIATTELHIGVATISEETFMAHAWVEWQGKIIIGESTDGIVYKPIWLWN